MVFLKLNKYMYIAACTVIIAIMITAYAFVHTASNTSGSSSLNTTTAMHQVGIGPRTTPAAGAAKGPVPTAVYGQVPQGWHPGSGTLVMGTAADKAKTAALAKFSGGTINRVLQLSDSSYAVHIIGTSGPHHVFVNKDFQVTGAA